MVDGSGLGKGDRPVARSAAADVFRPHDTDGFPVDLAVEIAAEHGLDVDVDGFRRLMSDQKRQAREVAWAKGVGRPDLTVFRRIFGRNGATEWLAHETLSVVARVLGIMEEGIDVPVAGPGAIVTVVLDRTPFYPESGGQESDAGTLTGPSFAAEILDVRRVVGGLIVHRVRVTEGDLVAGGPVWAEVDHEWRTGARQAHSGTHIVHAALRGVLGPAVLQAGSYNRPGYLHLDFPWRGALSSQARNQVELTANLALRQDLPVEVHHMPAARAREIGALEPYGEAYGEKVRVVEIGGAWSRELCDGTHVARASQVGAIVLTGEFPAGAGRRRVEGVTGIEAFGYLARERDLVTRIAEQIHAPRAELTGRLSALMDRMKTTEQANRRLRERLLAIQASKIAADATTHEGFFVATARTEDDPCRLAELVLAGLPAGPAVTVIFTGTGVVISVNAAAVDLGVSATDLITVIGAGEGGGSARTAQGGAPADPDAAVARIHRLLPAFGSRP